MSLIVSIDGTHSRNNLRFHACQLSLCVAFAVVVVAAADGAAVVVGGESLYYYYRHLNAAPFAVDVIDYNVCYFVYVVAAECDNSRENICFVSLSDPFRNLLATGYYLQCQCLRRRVENLNSDDTGKCWSI